LIFGGAFMVIGAGVKVAGAAHVNDEEDFFH
jgi:hypothetical protein